MAILKCKMCGGDLEVISGATVAECEYCGTRQTLPKANDEVIRNLFNRANNLRIKCEFDKAEQIYEKILQQNDNEPEAHWGIILCKYGVEYVEDPKTFKRIPTCHRTSYDTVTADADYIAAIEKADVVSRDVYEAEAKAIDGIQKSILNIVNNEKPFDIFICYKETDENGKRTVDSTIANDIYHQLSQEGLKVFYSAITLEDKLGQEYEPYIFAALNSAKAMLVIGTKPEYFSAVWVKNEWSRYLKLMKNDRSKLLIPCYKDMDAYDLPEEFAYLQAQDMSKIGFINDVVRGIKKVVSKEETTKSTSDSASANTSALLKRVFMFLEDGEFERADDFCEQVLNIDPEEPQAYLGKLLCELKLKSEEELKCLSTSFDSSKYYGKIMRFGSEDLKNRINGYLQKVKNAEADKEIKRQEKENEKKDFLAKKRKEREFASGLVGIKGGFFCVRPDGTVYCGGDNKYGQCNVSEWEDIVAISSESDFTLGLRSDGTVVATGDNSGGQCNVSDWKDVVAICTAYRYSFGLKLDGTVVSAGGSFIQKNVSSWKNIVAISAYGSHVLGLRSDGTVVAAGYNEHGQCNVSDWTDIVAVSTSSKHSLGWRRDGTVVVTGDNEYGQCNVSNWENIVAVAAGVRHSVGVRADGVAMAVGDNSWHQCSINAFPNTLMVYAYTNTVQLPFNGTVGYNNVKLFDDYKNYACERKAAIEARKKMITYREKGLCRHCGGTFKGLFTKTCAVCGKKKDY